MKIRNVPFEAMGRTKVPAAERKGEKRISFRHVREAGNARVRMVDDSAGCQADYCGSRGHVLFVLEGGIVLELKDSLTFPLGRGMGFQAVARAFIVD